MQRGNRIKFRFWDKRIKNFVIPKAEGDFAGLEFNDWLEELQKDGLVIMQYTGLKDKNGKEIYEGDIVYCDYYKEIFKVTWGYFEDCCVEGETWVLDGLIFEPTVYYYSLDKEVEVIGNIYENSELVNKLRKEVKNEKKQK